MTTTYVKTRTGVERTPTVYIDGQVIPVKKVEISTTYDEKTKYCLPPDEKFVEYEESDLDWLIGLGMAPKLGVMKVYKKPVSTVMTIDGPKAVRFIEDMIDADHCN